MTNEFIVDGLVTFVYAPDLQDARRFYGDVLGLTLALDQGSCHIYQLRDGAYIGVCQCDDVQVSEGVILTIITQEVDAVYAAMHSVGIETDGAPRLNPKFGIYHFFARDFAGWRVEVQRFVSPDLPGVRSSNGR